MNDTVLSNIPKGHWEKGENAHGDKRGWSPREVLWVCEAWEPDGSRAVE